MGAMKINQKRMRMHTINVNMIRGRSYENFSIYHTKISKSTVKFYSKQTVNVVYYPKHMRKR